MLEDDTLDQPRTDADAADAGEVAAPTPASSVPAFAPTWAFFLDIDGTLLELASRPDDVVVEPGLLVLLNGLRHAAGGALALVSGRSLEDVTALFGPLAFAVAGQHGAEMSHARGGARRPRTPHVGLRQAVAELRTLAARHPGMLIEDKGLSVAIHYRLDPSLARSTRHAARALQRSLGSDFELLEGKHVVEIKPSGRNKGSAIADLLTEAPFSGRVPVFIGDDVTDEYGFEVVNHHRGHSVKVGPGRTQAIWRLPDAGAVRRWLSSYVRWREAGITKP